jgi:hypothetical protein
VGDEDGGLSIGDGHCGLAGYRRTIGQRGLTGGFLDARRPCARQDGPAYRESRGQARSSPGCRMMSILMNVDRYPLPDGIKPPLQPLN